MNKNTFNLAVLFGTVYLIGWCGWNPWWFLVGLWLMASHDAEE